MATVALDYLYLHLAADLSTYLALELDALKATPSKAGSVRPYANGRRRAYTAAGSDLSISVTCEQVSRDDVDTLTEWVEEGYLLMLRDPRGRVVWGHAFALDVEEVALDDAANLTFTFTTVTYDQEV